MRFVILISFSFTCLSLPAYAVGNISIDTTKHKIMLITKSIYKSGKIFRNKQDQNILFRLGHSMHIITYYHYQNFPEHEKELSIQNLLQGFEHLESYKNRLIKMKTKIKNNNLWLYTSNLFFFGGLFFTVYSLCLYCLVWSFLLYFIEIETKKTEIPCRR